MDKRQIIIGKKAPSNYVLAIAHAVADGTTTAELVARGNQNGKAVTVAMEAARANMIALRPKVVELSETAHPDGGAISTMRITLGEAETAELPAKPMGEPIIVGQKDASVYALAIRARLTRGAPSVLVRARQEGPICKAVTAANLAASLGLAHRPRLAVIGEEAVQGGRMVPFIEITVSALPQERAEKKPFWRLRA
jgi:DNA-binding protein